MSFTYDLTAEPWIPCLLTDGNMRDMSLAEVLAEAPSIREVLDPSPLVTASLHRLLLAIVHRIYGPRDDEVWEEMWLSGRFEEDKIGAYFREWRHRFDLFDGDRPFYQTPGMPETMLRSVNVLSLELAARDDKTLFDHSEDETATPISASLAARQLLACQAFSLGGLISAEKERKKDERSAKAAPLATAAVTMIHGMSLFHTLMLNAVCYDRDGELPSHFPNRNDCPAWEDDTPPGEEERAPKGYLDYLTWQSRRLYLRPRTDPQGTPVVPAQVAKVIVARGRRFPPNEFPLDTMTPRCVNPKAKAGEDPRPPIRFDAKRALWRDSLALMQADGGIAAATLGSRPETLSNLALLVEIGVIGRDAVCSVSAMGLCSEQKRVDFWRHERVPLPLAYLGDDALVGILRAALGLAEDVARALGRAVRGLASTVLQGGEGRRVDRGAVTQLVDSLGQPAGYWSSLEPAFPTLLQVLPEADEEVRETALVAWAATVEREVWRAWSEAIAGLPENARSMRAVVAAEGGLSMALGSLFNPYKEVKDDEA